jgi:hypothetical protein
MWASKSIPSKSVMSRQHIKNYLYKVWLHITLYNPIVQKALQNKNGDPQATVFS